MFGVVLTNRELSDCFAMLAGPLAHVILVLLRHHHVQEDALSLGYLLGVPLSREPDSTS